jgi:1,2-diacylglycerol 3-beta-galactosyltransferase
MSGLPVKQKMQVCHSPKRFLFIISDTGGGHRASANAVKDAMFSLYDKEAFIDTVDLFVEMDRWPFDRFPDWYPHFVSKRGLPWALSFYLSNRVRLVKTMSRIVWPYVRNAMCEVLREHPADVIVSFHPIPNHGIQLALQHLGWQIPVATVAVDLVSTHASWFVPGADVYLVPTKGAKQRAIRWGIAPNRIFITGMPTRRSFREVMALPQYAAREQLTIPQDKPAVLIVGGGEGMGPLAEVVQSISQKNLDIHITVIAGRNKSLQQELMHMSFSTPVQVMGFVDNMEIWMRAADILVTKAGPNTLSEAFISGLPMVLYTAIPGQEEGNITHVVNNGAGLWAPQPRVTASAVEYLIKHPEARERMAVQSRKLARPYASNEIALKLWELVSISGAENQSTQQHIHPFQSDQPFSRLEEC